MPKYYRKGISSNANPCEHCSIALFSILGHQSCRDTYDNLVKMTTVQERTRIGLLREVVATEKRYYESLVVFLEVFVSPIADKWNPKSNSDARDTFSKLKQNIILINSVSKALLDELLGAEEKDVLGDQIGEIFTSIIPMFKVYRDFFTQQKSVSDEYNELLKSNRRFRSLINTITSNPSTIARVRGQTFESFLILPIQRIPRYEMLLMGLLKNTKSEDCSLAAITNAASGIKDTAAFLNECIAREEATVSTIAIQSAITVSPTGGDSQNSDSSVISLFSFRNNDKQARIVRLLAPYRYFLMEADFFVPLPLPPYTLPLTPESSPDTFPAIINMFALELLGYCPSGDVLERAIQNKVAIVQQGSKEAANLGLNCDALRLRVFMFNDLLVWTVPRGEDKASHMQNAQRVSQQMGQTGLAASNIKWNAKDQPYELFALLPISPRLFTDIQKMALCDTQPDLVKHQLVVRATSEGLIPSTSYFLPSGESSGKENQRPTSMMARSKSSRKLARNSLVAELQNDINAVQNALKVLEIHSVLARAVFGPTVHVDSWRTSLEKAIQDGKSRVVHHDDVRDMILDPGALQAAQKDGNSYLAQGATRAKRKRAETQAPEDLSTTKPKEDASKAGIVQTPRVKRTKAVAVTIRVPTEKLPTTPSPTGPITSLMDTDTEAVIEVISDAPIKDATNAAMVLSPTAMTPTAIVPSSVLSPGLSPSSVLITEGPSPTSSDSKKSGWLSSIFRAGKPKSSTDLDPARSPVHTRNLQDGSPLSRKGNRSSVRMIIPVTTTTPQDIRFPSVSLPSPSRGSIVSATSIQSSSNVCPGCQKSFDKESSSSAESVKHGLAQALEVSTLEAQTMMHKGQKWHVTCIRRPPPPKGGKHLNENVCVTCEKELQEGEEGVRVNKRLYHVEHYVCYECGVLLDQNDDAHTISTVNSSLEKAACIKCYEEKMMPQIGQCAGCEGILSLLPKHLRDKELTVEEEEEALVVLNGLDALWHKACFTCARCDSPFVSGEYYIHPYDPDFESTLLDNGFSDTTTTQSSFARKTTKGKGIHKGKAAYCMDDHLVVSSPKCPGCNKRPVIGGLQACGEVWHARCFTCTACNCVFENGYYEVGNKPFCPEDYFNMFGPQCGGCEKPLRDEPYVHACGKVWHHHCFNCASCSASLVAAIPSDTSDEKGEDKSKPVSIRFWARDGKGYDRDCFMRLFCEDCPVCGEKVLENGKRVMSAHYHADCIRCSVCNIILTETLRMGKVGFPFNVYCSISL